jgi:hypothetical protein
MSDLEKALIESVMIADRIREAIVTADRRIATLALADVMSELATTAVEDGFDCGEAGHGHD